MQERGNGTQSEIKIEIHGRKLHIQIYIYIYIYTTTPSKQNQKHNVEYDVKYSVVNDDLTIDQPLEPSETVYVVSTLKRQRTGGEHAPTRCLNRQSLLAYGHPATCHCHHPYQALPKGPLVNMAHQPACGNAIG